MLAICAAACAVALGAYAFMGTYSRYAGDDYCWAGVVVSQGFVGAQSWWYVQWSGRFAYTLATSALDVAGTSVVPLLPALAILGWVATGAWALSQVGSLARWRHYRLVALALATMGVFASIKGAPSVDQSLYWQTGMLTYLLPLVLATGYIGWLARQLRWARRARPGPRAALVGALIAFFAGGFSETYVALQMCALGAGIVLTFLTTRGRTRRTLLIVLAAGLVGSAAAAAIVLAAPGNAIREGQLTPNLSKAAWSALDDLFPFLRGFEAVNRPAFALTILLPGCVGFFVAPSGNQSFGQPGIRRRLAIIVAVAALAGTLLWSSLFPGFYALGSYPPARALFTPQVVLVASLATEAYLAARLFARRTWSGHPALAAISGLIVLTLGLVPLSAVPGILAGRAAAAQYAEQWDMVDQQIRTARTNQEANITVPTLPDRWTFPFLLTDPEGFPNTCMARYYGVETLRSTGLTLDRQPAPD